MPARIDHDLEQMIADRQTAVRNLLRGARSKLDQLVQTLLHEETIDRETLTQVLGERSAAEAESKEEVQNVAVPA